MAWSCKIASIRDDAALAGTRWLDVTFTKGDQNFSRTYKLVPGNFQDADQVAAFLAERISELEAMDVTALAIAALVGQELVPGQGLPVPKSLPGTVTNFQARSALIAAGLFNTVDAAIKALGVDSDAYQAWEYNNTFTITSPLLNQIASQLGLSADELALLFQQAEVIEV